MCPRLSLLSRLVDVPVAAVDVETTGSDPRYGDRVTEVGIARHEPDGRVTRVAQLVDPGRPIPQKITELTGITHDMVHGLPPLAARLGEVVRHLRGAVLVGHNVRFDLKFLGHEFRRAGTTLAGELGGPFVLDTVLLARRRFGRGGNGLQTLSRRLGVVPTGAHRALDDAVTTLETLGRLLEPLGGFGCTICDALALQGSTVPLEQAATPQQDACDGEIVGTLLAAASARVRLRMTYLDARRRETCRDVEPLEVRRFRGTGTLVAWCCLRGDTRTFKLDRIIRIEAAATA